MFILIRCFLECGLLSKIFEASVKYLKPHMLDLVVGLIARLVLSNEAFVEQFAHTIESHKVFF